MTYARKTLVSLNDTPYYHVVARCVRRAWLWGFDEYAGRDYSHRKEWILERLAQPTSDTGEEVEDIHQLSRRFLELAAHLARHARLRWWVSHPRFDGHLDRQILPRGVSDEKATNVSRVTRTPIDFPGERPT
jgi:hypothetical protein